MTPKRPTPEKGWTRHRSPAFVPGAEAWQRGPICVLSALTPAKAPDGSGDVIYQWHVSVSRRGKRPRPKDVARVRRSFGMLDAEEDNHHPGAARHLWMPVDASRRVDCECKATEETMVEPDGYTWTNPTAESGEGCRGCDLARDMLLVGRSMPCPMHE